jgi:CheY-like chemotaxis protein
VAHIAIIEDSPIDRSYQAAVLRKAGWEVAFVEPTEPLVMIGQLLENPPDLLLLDYMLPNLRGDSIAELCHRHPALKHIPIVVLTAHQDLDLVPRFRALGVKEVLFKPISQFLLTGVVQKHLPGGAPAQPFRLDPL